MAFHRCANSPAPDDAQQVDARIVDQALQAIAGTDLKDHGVILRAVLQAMAIAVAGLETGAVAGCKIISPPSVTSTTSPSST